MHIELSLNRHKRIKQKKLFDELFSKKQSKLIYIFPFKVIYILKDDIAQTKIGLSVPKRNFKLAVNRNLIKRRIKEAYRINQNILTAETNNKFILFFIYTSKTTLKYQDIEKGMIKIFRKLNKENNVLD